MYISTHIPFNFQV